MKLNRRSFFAFLGVAPFAAKGALAEVPCLTPNRLPSYTAAIAAEGGNKVLTPKAYANEMLRLAQQNMVIYRRGEMRRP